MTSNLKRELRKARPSLAKVSPLADYIIRVLGFFNLIFGSILLLNLTSFRFPLFIVNDIFTYEIWGAIFIALGLFKLYSLAINNWSLARLSLLIGVTIKAVWMTAFYARLVVGEGSIVLALMWSLLALIQMGVYIFYLPPSSPAKRRHDG